MGTTRAQQAVDVAGSPAECYEAILAFETYPDWQGAMKDVEVLERDDEGRGKLVEFTIDAKVKRVRYVLRYHYDEPARVWWEYVEGDIKDVEGDITFEDRGEATTRAVYRLEIDPGRFVPGPIKRLLTDGVMRDFVKELKARVEGSAV
jgi:ribosome-associated toxin RatA of RatAB toxin-antitoxin module